MTDDEVRRGLALPGKDRGRRASSDAGQDALDHDSVVALLPWLANGTLQGEERERAERHVRTCLPCRAELAEQTKLRTLMQRQPVVHMSADASFERLRQRLDRRPAPPLGVPRRVLWAAAAAVAIAGVGWLIAAALLSSRPPAEPAFVTLTESAVGADGRASADGALLVDVIFAEGVRESEMRALLDELGAEIVAGPSRTLGRYTLRVAPATDARSSDAPPIDARLAPAPSSDAPPGQASASDAPAGVDAIVRRLLDDERIRFAGPTFSLPAVAPDPSDQDR